MLKPFYKPFGMAGIALGAVLAASSSIAAVSEFTLDNGLRILVKEDHRAPVVVSQIWYKVGSSYEHGGITGVSHVLEHMMFKGTRQHAPGDFSRIIAENGGRENAFTGKDYTAYYQRLEKSRLPISFELEADRMYQLRLLDEEFAKEIKVVMEERRLRTEDNPQSQTYENFVATAFQTSPYHNPIIGWMNDLDNMELKDLADWYKAWYVPNNATLVVSGDVDPKEVYQLAKKYYGKVPRGDIATLKPQREVKQRGIRRINVKLPAKLPVIYMGYLVPSLKTVSDPADAYALEVLAGILDGGNSARLPKNLVRGSQVAASAGAGYDLYSRLDTLFLFSGTPSQKHNIKDLEKSLLQQIRMTQDTLVKQQELDRVKAQVVAEKVYELDSVFYQAMQIGQLETIGIDSAVLDEYVDRIKAVTPEKIREVARKYLIDDSLTVATLDPQSMQPLPSRPAVSGGGHGR
ncbi:MAG: pitrilysin family protein [Gammaproteobacteria bacterium]|nr:MAG: pitrilysin family protein [Gammaproteobacteria bacterium]